MKKILSVILAASTTVMLAGEPSDPKKEHTGIPVTKLSFARKMQANSEGQANIVVKMNVSQLLLGTLAFQREYGFHKNMSFALGAHFLLPKKAPKYFAEEDPTGEGLRDTKLKGFAITPEFRFYPGAKEEHQAPHGFYLAPYFRYARFTFTSGYHDVYYDDVTKKNVEYGYDMKVTYKGNTIGLMIGSQWIIGDHFSIDWWIIGAGFGKADLEMRADGQGFTLDQDAQDELKKQLEREFAAASFIGSKPVVETTATSAKVTIPNLPMRSIRAFGLCLGYAF